jgi:hypothetical protein
MNGASLGFAAFSGTVDLLHACKKAYEAWRSLKELDEDLELLRNELSLQQALLEQWQRDWYSFNITGPTSIGRLRLLKSNDDAVREALNSILKLVKELEPLRETSPGSGIQSSLDRIRWVADKKKRSEHALTHLDRLLSSLCRLLPLRSPNIEASQMIVFMQHLDDGIPSESLGETIEDRHASAVFKKTLALQRYEKSLRVDLQKRVEKFQSIISGPSLEIPTSRVRGLKPDEVSLRTRSFGEVDGQPMIIEWKKYDASWQGQRGIQLRGRLDNLARLLNEEKEKPEELLTLHCIGYIDRVEEAQYGFVFAKPGAVEDKVISLDQLLDKPTAPTLPTLEQRYQIAYSLALTLAILHTCEWLHKSIRSSNVLFVSSGGQVQWARPYLVGFEYSRPDKPDQSSEKPQQSAKFNLYRHPLSQGSPKESYKKAFDVYSFGTILLEIGLWRPIYKWYPGGLVEATKFQETLTELATERLVHNMGVEFSDAALKCITGVLERDNGSILKAFFIEVVEVLGRLLVKF